MKRKNPVRRAMERFAADRRRGRNAADAIMPLLVASVLRLLLEALGSSREAAALGSGPEGTAQPLPLALRRTAALAALETLGDPEQRSLRSLLRRLDTVVIPEPTWRTLIPEGATLRDVDRPDDLPPPP